MFVELNKYAIKDIHKDIEYELSADGSGYWSVNVQFKSDSEEEARQTWHTIAALISNCPAHLKLQGEES